MVHKNNMSVRETSITEKSKASVSSCLITADLELLVKWTEIQYFLNVNSFKDRLTASSVMLFL